MIYLVAIISVVAAIFFYKVGQDSEEKKELEDTVKAMEARNEVEDNIHTLDLSDKRKRLLDDSH